MKLAPSLHRIGNDIVAAYLVEAEEGITLIDAGLAGHWNELLAELRAMGRPLEDVRGLILTHGDSDHIGFAERIRRDHGVPVFVHSADAARAKGGDKPKTPMGPVKLGAAAGFFGYSLSKGGLRTTYLTAVREVEGGQVLDLPGAPEIVSLPGHSPGSIAVYVSSLRALFVGDALTTRHVLTGKQGPQPAPFTDDMPAALDSLRSLQGRDADWVLPGHGAPWSAGIDAAVAEVERQSPQRP